MARKFKNIFVFGFAPTDFDLPETFTARSGDEIEVFNDYWELSGKGSKYQGQCYKNVSWIGSLQLDNDFKYAIIDTLIYYAQKKSAATFCTINLAVRKSFENVNSFERFKEIWPELVDSRKKTTKSFFSVAYKHHEELMEKWYKFTQKFIYKATPSVLHPTKGRLTDFEYDSYLSTLRNLCNYFKTLNIYQIKECFFTKQANSEHYNPDNENISFDSFRNLVSTRVLTQLVRRPSQICMIKWNDILPIGVSFNDEEVNMEPMPIGAVSLHIRIHKVKQNDSDNEFRATVEKNSIHISEDISEFLLKYKVIYMHGFRQCLINSKVVLSDLELHKVFSYLPLIPDLSLFSFKFTNKNLKEILDKTSEIFHVDGGSIGRRIASMIDSPSDRTASLSVSNNRLRHTVASNAAFSGHSIEKIARITDVTIPAARIYIDLGTKERELIDEKYKGNDFLKRLFNPVSKTSIDDEIIGSIDSGSLGIGKEKSACNACENKMRFHRPIPCYGCSNFVPIKEANHRNILEKVDQKLKFLEENALTNLQSGSTKRLLKAKKYIEVTITICDELIKQERAVETNGNKG
ncbi:hypothetical protein RT723_01750 [Psychrosphaera aquimarina]|uniref:Phage integrase family protein n=1 Tax=Psychrosphaera aquimarina TaxID=2044854 RepID=A0ABU3QWF7_9GAMM|nr:hypothetical protein [Psychrosphaera aquimarina]MDU0111753.1 hypothetical protein [Psychrosphaera aquimarina]